jgi:hypothetical protein
MSGGQGVELLTAVRGDEAALDRADRTADLQLVTREALEIGLAARFGRHERIREWTYDLDPARAAPTRRRPDPRDPRAGGGKRRAMSRSTRGPDAADGRWGRDRAPFSRLLFLPDSHPVDVRHGGPGVPLRGEFSSRTNRARVATAPTRSPAR